MENLYLRTKDLNYNDADAVQAVVELLYSGKWKYNEDKSISDILSYVNSTYSQHYASDAVEDGKVKNLQMIDIMHRQDIASAFCKGNILKYAGRYGIKNGCEKKDLLKVIHYAILLLHFDGHYETTQSE